MLEIVIWLGGIIAPWLLFKIYRYKVTSALHIPPELGKGFAFGVSVFLSVVFGIITKPAKPVVRDAYYSLVKAMGIAVAGDRRNINDLNNAGEMYNRQ